jgi:adenylate cyclase class IV
VKEIPVRRNIEIKIPLADPDAVRARALDLGAVPEWTRRQRDVFFAVPRGYLKLRSAEGAAGELIAYSRDPGPGPRASRYRFVAVPDPQALEGVLALALPVLGTVEKVRELLLWKHTRIHLDRVRDLGRFLELETVTGEIDLDRARREAEEAIDLLGLDRGAFLDRPYLELLAEAADGPPAREPGSRRGPGR